MPRTAYTPLDPTLRSLDHRVAELRVDGELRAHLACIVGEIRFPVRSPWLWYVIVWPDGFTEYPQEDYGPDWLLVRELDEGFFLGPARPSTEHRRTLLGIDLGVWRSSCPDEVRYDVVWLTTEESATTWDRLGLTDDHF